jgi:FkbM family methyltransferase
MRDGAFCKSDGTYRIYFDDFNWDKATVIAPIQGRSELLMHEKAPIYYAQYGEDKILDNIFNKRNGTCVEVGGYDGVTGSNTYYFEKLGWRCLLIEPMPDFCRRIRENRHCDVVEMAASNTTGEAVFYVADSVETLSTMEAETQRLDRINKQGGRELKKITVKTARLTDILLSKGMKDIDFLTIDVEGHEMAVLQGLSFDIISPRIVIIESNPDGFNNEVTDFMKSASYVRFKITRCNDWFAKKDDPIVTVWSLVSTDITCFLRVLKRRVKPF